MIKNYVYDGALVKLEVKVDDKILKINEYDNDIFCDGEEVYITIDDKKIIVVGDKYEKE